MEMLIYFIVVAILTLVLTACGIRYDYLFSSEGVDNKNNRIDFNFEQRVMLMLLSFLIASFWPIWIFVGILFSALYFPVWYLANKIANIGR